MRDILKLSDFQQFIFYFEVLKTRNMELVQPTHRGLGQWVLDYMAANPTLRDSRDFITLSKEWSDKIQAMQPNSLAAFETCIRTHVPNDYIVPTNV